MKFSRKDYENFLKTELETQIKEYEQVVRTKALVLKDCGAVFVGRFIKFQSNGMAIFKVRYSETMPCKNSFWTASCFISVMASYKNWGNYSWAELRKQYQSTYSEAMCAWIQKSNDPGFCLIGVKKLTTDFADSLEAEQTIVAFGPNDPPLQYLLNLISIVRDPMCVATQEVLDYDEKMDNLWNPIKVRAQENFISMMQLDINNSKCVVVQGPPGTGKTYRMAQLAATLLENNQSVLVTALTNQALMELAKKKDIQSFLNKGRVSKASLTTDESSELPSLQKIHNNACNASSGYLSLATFYISSSWAVDNTDIPFDYVIMDEASQALLPMIAAAMKLGRKVILIGDQKQLPPIVVTNEDIINKFRWNSIIRGFETICRNFSYKSYMLSDTFRLTKRGADSTGIFYGNELHSVAEAQVIPSKLPILNQQGGPIFMGLDLMLGNKAPKNALESIFNTVCRITSENTKAEIAVLSKFRESVSQLQNYFVKNWTVNAELPDNIRIATVDKVQGLTVDYCIFFIPNASLHYSLINELFNVATSRAKYCTIIYADNSILKENMTSEIRKYLLKAQENKFAYFEPQTISSGNIGVTITGKIDLSQFERKRKEIDETQENIYIIDTNVFVNCPDIISRIGNKYQIVIPAKVLEELDKLKLKTSVDKKQLNEVAKNINAAFIKHYSKMEEADLSLLPNDFDKSNPDCMILSVALKYKSKHPILLTSDNLLQSRANGLGITTISLKDFLRR